MWKFWKSNSNRRVASCLLSLPLSLMATACSQDHEDPPPVHEQRCGSPEVIDQLTAPDLAELKGCAVHEGKGLMISVPVGLEDLAALGRLREVVGNFSITDCLDLVSLHGLEQLEQAKGLTIVNAHGLRDLRGLDSLRSLENLLVMRLFGLESMRGLEPLETVSGFVSLKALDKLESVDGLQGLHEVGELEIANNQALRSLQGLSRLKTIGSGGLAIRNNPQLPQSEIDALLARVEVEGPIRIESNMP